jgi:PPM family protein phosphatase
MGELGMRAEVRDSIQEGIPLEDISLIPAALTDSGCEREFNEDRYAVIDSPSGLAWFVCDGMGGVTGGELAAQLAIDTIRRDLEGKPLRSAGEALESAVIEANRVIILRRQNELFSGMGTTLVGALFQGSEVVLSHVGDSRAYVVKGGEIEQLTVDHTYVQELIYSGKIKSEEALTHPQSHILTKCIGAEPGLEVQLKRFWIWPTEDQSLHNHMVLVTDGLYTLVSDQEIASVVTSEPPQDACVKLVELAKVRGGYDNITIAVVPLGGELRRERPEGFLSWTEQGSRIENEHFSAAVERQRLSVGKVVTYWLLLTIITLAAVAGGMLFLLSR